MTELTLCNTDLNLQVEHFTEVLNNILTNFIPHDDVALKPKTAPWLPITFLGLIINTDLLINPIFGMDVNLK